MFQRLLAIALSVSLLAAGESAATGSWARVTAIRTGANVKVARTGEKKRLAGTFAGASEDAVRVDTRGSVVSIPRSDVKRVEVAVNRKGRRAAIGAAIGAGVGAASLGGAAAASNKPGAEPGVPGLLAVGGLVLGGGIGALVGMAVGSGYNVVYETAPASKNTP
ncbi:MAG: hypothetical protein U0Q16_18685 [Bryobacteraceae bacterium]